MCIRDRLADQFTDPALHVWKYDAATLAPVMFGREGRVPLKPFAGTIGCCLLYTSDAADERSSVDLGGRRIIKKNTKLYII